MNVAANKIYQKVQELAHDAEKVESDIKSLKKLDNHLKSDMHATELKIALDALAETERENHMLVHDISEIKHDHDKIKNNEQKVKQLEQKLKNIRDLIESDTFWMRRADTDDINRQKESLEHVFS